MLRPDQAKARLAEWQIPEKVNRLAEGLPALPEPVRKPVETLFGLNVKVGARSQEELDAPRKAALELERLGPALRAPVFNLIAPPLVASLEAAWQLIKSLPYQAGYYKKAFRAPGHPAAAADNQANWLSRMAELTGRFRPERMTPAWLSAWAPYLGEAYRPFEREIGILLAAVIRESLPEAAEVIEILRQSLANQHEVGCFGRHVIGAFLLADRREGWELAEKTLLAAQRQEGLRQAILETIDLSHPKAFRRMLRLILENDLVRFSSVVRAVDVWFGNLWTAASAGEIRRMLTQVLRFLDEPIAEEQALGGDDPQEVFLALWCLATDDAMASIPKASVLLESPTVEMRYVAARHLNNLDLDAAGHALLKALRDEDLRVALLAVPEGSYFGGFVPHSGTEPDDRFELVERLLERVPDKPVTLEPLVWPWTKTTVDKSQIASCLLFTRGERPATRLVPYLANLSNYSRAYAVGQLLADRPWNADTRQALFDLAGDAAAQVRDMVLSALMETTLTPTEAGQLERYLTRKAGDLRRGILAVLLKQDDSTALGSSSRLVSSKDGQQRLAGLEILRHMNDARRSVLACRQLAAEHRSRRKKLSPEEIVQLDEIARGKDAIATLDDALGLSPPDERTKVTPPRNLNVTFVTPATVNCLVALDALVHEHRETVVQLKTHGGFRPELLGNIWWDFPSPNRRRPAKGQEKNLPLANVWCEWLETRSPELRDNDGLELVRAQALLPACVTNRNPRGMDWADSLPARKTMSDALMGPANLPELKYQRVLGFLLDWLVFLSRCRATDFLLDALETAQALVPPGDLAGLTQPLPEAQWFSPPSDGKVEPDWRDAVPFLLWYVAACHHLGEYWHRLTPEQEIRVWRLLAWYREPIPGARRRQQAGGLFVAYEHRAAGLADVADYLFGARGRENDRNEEFSLLSEFTARKPDDEFFALLTKHPELRRLIDQGVERILHLELNRGDAHTAATEPAYAIHSLSGVDTLCRVLAALNKREFNPVESRRDRTFLDRCATLTHLAKVTFPAGGESPDECAQRLSTAVKAGQFPEERLLQLVFLAPQWIPSVERYFGFDHLREGVYWFLAHMGHTWRLSTKLEDALDEVVRDAAEDPPEDHSADQSDDVDWATSKPARKKLSAWDRLLLERTPLSSAERLEGAIDVAWFRRTHGLLGEKQWQALAAAARFGANAAQANHARFIADVLLSRVSRQTLIDGIKKRQLKDHVRLLGLLPLATGKKREADLAERYRVLREYRRYANQLSGLTKPQAVRAWEIGMKNLAQTAGYPDPLRLEWAMGAETVRDLAQGPVKVSKLGIDVTISLDDLSSPQLTVAKGGKVLKSIPAAVKKDKKVAELLARVTDIKRQASAIRQSLEAAMCRGDVFTGSELRAWSGHALLAPLLTRLVVVGEGILGYPDKHGKALRDCRGKLEPVKLGESLRIAHPHDLLKSGKWHAWQHECFQQERVQPFKQLFRELYVVTKQEKKDGAISHRYDGQQVQQQKALALFGSRGWHTSEGICKVFQDAGLTVWVDFLYGGGTPLEVEGATLAGVHFSLRDDWKPLKLSRVPPRLFSEVMRDLDLVVGVAHAGGVDPEASASTVEMRAALLRETCQLLKLDNVRLKPSHAVIDGQLAHYSVHLGSGTVHCMPGGALCLIPVHSQHRGRLFLPFADNDPRTAEVVSKVLLLARDDEIRDPSILEQIRAR
jgi:hypothetical protein